VAVNKTVGDDAPSVGENVTFVVTVTNRGPNTATAVVVEDAVPTGLSLVSAIPSQGTYTAPTWTIGDIGDGDEATLTIAATVTATGPIVNTAEKTQQGEADKNPANNRSTVTLNAGESANLDVTKTPTRLAAFVGEQLTFDVIVKNLGPSPASGVSLNDDLPAGLALVEAAASQGSYDQTTGIWSVGSIGATGSAVLSVRVTVTDPGTTVNTASIATSDQPDPDADNNSSSAIVAAARVADLAIAKTLAHGTTPGFEAVYSIVVTTGRVR
jgi:uncharacterized repeat protein (TIGR01451 family)